MDAGILGYLMYHNGSEFKRGEGIVGPSVSSTVTNVGVLAQKGMHETDQTILQIMTQ